MKKNLFIILCLIPLLWGLTTSCDSPNVSDKVSEKMLSGVQYETPTFSLILFCCDIARKKTGCKDGSGLCNCRWFPKCNESSLLDTFLYTDKSTMIISSHNNFDDKMDDIMYVDEDFALPKEVSEKMGFSEVIVQKGEYYVHKIKERTDVLVRVKMIK